MNNKPSSSKSASTPSKGIKNNNNDIISKLRRLRIEENLMRQSLEKLDLKRDYELSDSYISNDFEYKNYLKKVKDGYFEIMTLFDELKTVTCSQELLAELEINDIKKKVFDFETSLKSFKTHLNIELGSLKSAEQDVIRQLQEIDVEESNTKHNRKMKIPSANYNQVVPSPVQLMMTSPFKCTEVQEYNDFMKNSPNRFGGWNEYHHDIFVKYWQKHFGHSAVTEFNEPVVETMAFENFVEEALFQLQGINKKKILKHIEWYKKYIYLKNKQQNAIDKWKSTKRSIRKMREKVTSTKEPNSDTYDEIRSEDECEDFNQKACNLMNNVNEVRKHDDKQCSRISKCLSNKMKILKEAKSIPLKRKVTPEDIERLMKPTKQWIYRNEYDDQSKQHVQFLEEIEKLRIPHWRQYL